MLRALNEDQYPLSTTNHETLIDACRFSPGTADPALSVANGANIGGRRAVFCHGAAGALAGFRPTAAALARHARGAAIAQGRRLEQGAARDAARSRHRYAV